MERVLEDILGLLKEFWGILENNGGEVTMYCEPPKGKEVSKEGKQWEKTIDHRGFFTLICV